MRALCEATNCSEVAVGEVFAQWTVADFVTYDTCEEHIDDWIETLDRKRVEGEYPVDIYFKRWEL